MNPIQKRQVIDGKRYDTEKATLICGNDWWDGHNHERSGTNRFLYKTARGRFFFLNMTQWQGEGHSLEPTEEDEAQTFFEECEQHDSTEMSFEAAFPTATVEDA